MSQTEIAAGIIGLFIGLPLAYWSALRTVRREATVAQLRQARIDDIENRRPENVPAADDNEEGINRGLQDDCELLYGLPAWTEENR